MRTFNITLHPSMDELCDHRDGGIESLNGDTLIAVHVAECGTCQETMKFLRALAGVAAQLPSPAAPDALRARILASAAVTATPEAPVTTTTTFTTTTRSTRIRRWVPVAAVAAALAVVTLGSLFTETSELVAGATSGTMALSTAAPRLGESVTVRYTPGVSLSRFRTLRLRARVRTPDAEDYTANVPVVTMATLRRQRDGSYLGSFVLPDSLVYAALAVEDTSASEIDDRDGRTWEVMRGAVSGTVALSTLDQRVKDQMGRSWEEMFVTARRMVAEYPDSIAAWSFLATTQSWMGLPTDSIRQLNIARVRDFDRQMSASGKPSADDMGRMYWYAHRVDSAIAARWESRLRRDAPTNSFIVQNRTFDVLTALDADHDTTAALRAFEPIWADAPVDRRDQIISYATRIAVSSRDTAALRRWTDRLLAMPRVSPASVIRFVAFDFARVPALRAEGLQRLRDELVRLRMGLPLGRELDETQARHDARVQRSIQNTLAALGRALALDGQHRAALDTLVLAATQNWNVEVFRLIRQEALIVGDTAAAITVAARLAIDPRTPHEELTQLTSSGTARIGAELWRTTVATAQHEFVQRTLDLVRPRTIARAVPVRSLDGKTVDLRTSVQGHVTVVAFLSRFCGPAVEAIPDLQRLAARLGHHGVRTIAIFEETSFSADLSAFLRRHDVSLPVLLDHEKSASTAFQQWGTPYFYVVDDHGRIMSEPTSDLDELLVNAEAVRLSTADK